MTTFLDLVRKAAQEKKELIQKGGEGSGWYAPPKGTHVEGAEAGNIIPETYKQNKRTVGILDVKDRVRDYFKMRAGARGKGGKRIAVERRLAGATPGNLDSIYHHTSGGETVIEIQGTTKSDLYFPTKP